MESGVKEYRRLPGKGARRGHFFGLAPTRSTAWLADDHLLSVDNDYFSEDYKRFYFKDIQALSIRRTRTWEVANVVWGVLAILTSLGAYALDNNMFLWTMEGLFCLGLLVSLLRGPTCVFRLHTAVHTEEMPSLGRLKAALKAREILYPLIQQAQGEPFVPDVQLATAELVRANNVAGTESGIVPNPSGYQGGVHKVLFGLMSLSALVNLILLYDSHVGITVLNVFMGFGLFACAILAVVRQYETHMGTAIRTLSWTALGVLTVFYFIGMMHYMFVTVAYSDVVRTQWELMKIYSATMPKTAPWFLGLRVCFAVVSLSVSVPALILLLRQSRGWQE